ncbi:LysR family transcriptional regulator [Burkholderia sp. MSMB1078WGS]|uniref:LysR family transcriptional regulator n=2 Tax=unclassified Burkholderia TaxID=2613784 RepID=UPI00211D61F3|nr:LysR family transcriptional regulator [Burkholderia sp. MSMB1078WGS]
MFRHTINSILESPGIPLMDRLDAIRLFVRLVECGNFSAVGREHGIGQPAVSKKIGALETHLGAQLLMRTSRKVIVTDAGLAFYESAKQLIDDFDVLEASVGDRQRAPKGVVRVNTAPAHGRLCITPLLPEFFKRYPDVSVELSVSERLVDLVGDGVDLGIRHGQLMDSSLTAKKLTDADFLLVASSDYVAARGEPQRLSDLDRHACVVFSKDREPKPWAFKVKKETVSYVPHGSLMTGDAEHIRASVLCDLGIAQAPSWLFEEDIRSGKVRVLLPQLQPERFPIHLVYPAGRRLPMRVRVLVEFLVAAFKNGKP